MEKSYCTIKFYSNFPINEYSNQVYYSNSNTRDNVFDGYCSNREGVDLYKNIASPNKTSMSFRLETNYKNAMNYNYGVVIEDNKRYYFFINNVEWSSNLITATFSCEVDWWQTYCYNVEFKKSFVEREHVTDDTFGLHTLDENLPISDYLINDYNIIKADKDDYFFRFCVVLSDNKYIYGAYKVGDKRNRLPLFTHTSKGINIQTLTLSFANGDLARQAIDIMINNNLQDSIIGYYYCPLPKYNADTDNSDGSGTGKDDIIGLALFNTNSDTDVLDDGNYFLCEYIKQPNNIYNTNTMSLPKRISGYKPNNNKCFLYPYNFVSITNNQGNILECKFEDTNDRENINFRYNFPSQEGACINGYLYNYQGIIHNLDFSLNGAINVELPYITNTYSAYYSANTNTINNSYAETFRNYTTSMAQTTLNTASNMIGTATNLTALAFSGGVTATARGGASAMRGVTSTITDLASDIMSAELTATNSLERIKATLADQKSKGDIQRGSFTTSIMQNIGQLGFKMQLKQVREDNIRTIDNYFDMFGYKVNTIKVPQFDTRPSWNYIKTSDLNVIGNIPQIALNTIKKMFNNGTTIWHNIRTMYDYDQNNK